MGGGAFKGKEESKRWTPPGLWLLPPLWWKQRRKQTLTPDWWRQSSVSCPVLQSDTQGPGNPPTPSPSRTFLTCGRKVRLAGSQMQCPQQPQDNCLPGKVAFVSMVSGTFLELPSDLYSVYRTFWMDGRVQCCLCPVSP